MSEQKGTEAITFKETGSLNGFTGFDNEVSQVDDSFWDDKPKDPETDPKEVIEQVNADDNPDGDNNPPKTDEELAEELFPGEVADDVDDEIEIEDDPKPNGDGTVKETKPKKTKVDSITILETLKERGLADFELEEGEEMTEELAEELLEESYDAGVENRIKELFEDLPPVVKQLNQFVINGGNPAEFFNHVNKFQKVGITSDMDLKDEKNQEKVVRQLMKEEGEDDEVIEAQIEFYKDSGKLSTIAEKKFDKWNKAKEKQEEQMVQQQTQQRIINKQKLKEYKQNLSQKVTSLDLGEVKFSRKEVKEIPSYIADKTVKLQNGASISQRDVDLYDVLDNEKASLQLAYLLKNRNEDGTFNFKGIEKNVNTKITKEVKNNIRRNDKQTPSMSVHSGSSQKRELHDYF